MIRQSSELVVNMLSSGSYCSATTNRLLLRNAYTHLLSDFNSAHKKYNKHDRAVRNMLLHSTPTDGHTTIIYDESTQLLGGMQDTVNAMYDGITAIGAGLTTFESFHDLSLVLLLKSPSLHKYNRVLTKAYGFKSDYKTYKPHITLLTVPRVYGRTYASYRRTLYAYYRKLVHIRYDFDRPSFEPLT